MPRPAVHYLETSMHLGCRTACSAPTFLPPAAYQLLDRDILSVDIYLTKQSQVGVIETSGVEQ